MTEQIKRVKQYLAARDAIPMKQLGDGIHTVNVGSEHEGELRLSDLQAFARGYDLLAKKLKNCVHALTFAIDGWDETDPYITKLRATRDGAQAALNFLDTDPS